jgi:hypothetical protein
MPCADRQMVASALKKQWQERRSSIWRGCGLADADLSVHTRNMESAVCLFRNSLMFVMRWA